MKKIRFEWAGGLYDYVYQSDFEGIDWSIVVKGEPVYCGLECVGFYRITLNDEIILVLINPLDPTENVFNI